MFHNFFSRKSCNFLDNVAIYCKAGHATDDNMTHAHCTLVTRGYKCTLKICNTYCFPLQQWLHSSAPFYVVRTLPVLLDSPENRQDSALKHNSFFVSSGLCVPSPSVILHFGYYTNSAD